MRLSCVSGCLAAVIATSGCYGTKVPPPERSGLGPITSVSTMPHRRPPALPAALTDLIAAYRQHLVEEAHHLSPDMARHYAEIEVQTMATSYEGREGEMRAEIERRMMPPVPRPQAIGGQGAANFPVDPQESNGGRQ